MSCQVARAGSLSFKPLLTTAAQLEAQLAQSTSESTKLLLIDRLRDAYVACLFADVALAQRHEIDQTLWKVCFYRPIEAQRRNVRALAAAGDQRGLQQATRPLMSTIEQALHFYSQLTTRLTAVAGSQLSAQRCHIFQGDLERYAQLHNGQLLKAWGPASAHYTRALQLHPSNGHPHNQLAVLAGYRGAHCDAIYHYCLAVAAEQPFRQARINVRQHLSRCVAEQLPGYQTLLLQLLRGDADSEQQLVSVLLELSAAGHSEQLYQTVVIVSCLSWGADPLMPQLQQTSARLLTTAAQLAAEQRHEQPGRCFAALEFGSEQLMRGGAPEQQRQFGLRLQRIIDGKPPDTATPSSGGATLAIGAGGTRGCSGGSLAELLKELRQHAASPSKADSQSAPLQLYSPAPPELYFPEPQPVLAAVQAPAAVQSGQQAHGRGQHERPLEVARYPTAKRRKISSGELVCEPMNGSASLEHCCEEAPGGEHWEAVLGGEHLINARIIIPSWVAQEKSPSKPDEKTAMVVERLVWESVIHQVHQFGESPKHGHSCNPYCNLADRIE